jgi:hypothetical protein
VVRCLTALEAASAYRAAGLSVIPVCPDGTKAPALVTWRPYRGQPPRPDEVERWFGNGHAWGVAVVCGHVSRDLEVLDFDRGDAFERWRLSVEAVRPGFLAAVPRVRTPRGGVHLYLFRRMAGPSRKLWKDAAGKTVAEVKGEGGYVLAPGCPPACHPAGKEYRWEVPLPGVPCAA